MTKALETQKIDVGPLFMDGNAVAPTLNAEIAAALRDDGSFVAVGLPDSKGLAGRSADLLAFFTFPEAVRHPLAVRKHRASSINIYRGYYPPPAGRHWSYNENFDIGPEPPLPVSDGPGTEGLREANVWPAEPAFKPWREAMLAFAGDCRRAATVILAAAARGLELDPERLLRPSRGRNGTLRLLHYPSIPPHFDLMEQMEEDEDPPADGRRILGRIGGSCVFTRRRFARRPA